MTPSPLPRSTPSTTPSIGSTSPPPAPALDTQRFVGFLDGEQVFRDLLDHEAILEPILEMCGPKARLDHAYGIVMSPGTGGLGLHGGGTPHDPAQFYEVRGNHMYNGLVAVQWALVDHNRGDGGFCCVPGSHRANFPRPSGHPASWVVEVPMMAGDVADLHRGADARHVDVVGPVRAALAALQVRPRPLHLGHPVPDRRSPRSPPAGCSASASNG